MHSRRPPTGERARTRFAPPTPPTAGPTPSSAPSVGSFTPDGITTPQPALGSLEDTGAPGKGRSVREAAPLRLAIGKGGLGLELDRPFSLDCLEIMELVVALPTVRFPLDVSGGVARFRHRRGTLDRVSVELRADRLRKWAASRLRDLVAKGGCEVWIGVEKMGARVAISAANQERVSVLAFDITALVEGESLSL
ncbi:MAG TPA: hypothetical protein VNO21_26270, partial [Polyangiaceae bacterium]|nr:hypothetical protein [Polyangiaceae bacterium]